VEQIENPFSAGNKMNTEFIDPFVKSTIDTFYQLLSLSVNPGNPRPFDEKKDFLNISSIIGLAGEVQGEVILSFPYPSCKLISEKFTGIASKEIDDTVIDAIGELVNVVAGNAKDGLLQFKIYISIPNIIDGDQNLRLTKNCPAITVPFQFENGNFNLIVTLLEK